MERTFLHIDMDAFYASVEQRDHPEWRGRPVIVGAPPDQRGVVSAASYEARKYGIHSAMPSREAGKRCPQAVFAPVDMARYQEVSAQVFTILERFTPFVEPLSIDEAFLDVSGAGLVHGSGEAIAAKIKAAIRDELQLSASVGVAPNKFLAKLASELNKPDGLTVVPRAPPEIMEFLEPLPIHRLWGVGKVTQALLERAGIRTIGDMQRTEVQRLARLVGPHAAEQLKQLARGEDSREIELDHDEKSISREHTFLEDCSDPGLLESLLAELVDDVAARLRDAGKYASVVHLKLRWRSFHTITRQKSLAEPCCDTFTLANAALELFRAEALEQPVRLIGVGVGGLSQEPSRQLHLFETESAPQKRREELSRAMDRIRARYGDESIRRAATLPTDRELELDDREPNPPGSDFLGRRREDA